jgi:hypothetical protein
MHSSFGPGGLQIRAEDAMSPCELQKMSTADAVMSKPFPPAVGGVRGLWMEEA